MNIKKIAQAYKLELSLRKKDANKKITHVKEAKSGGKKERDFHET